MKSNEQNVGISFVCQSLGNGGAERVVSILINYFYQKKYNVQLVLLYENTIDYYIPENISVIFLNWADKKNPLKFLPRLKQLRNTIKGDIVFSFLFLATVYKGNIIKNLIMDCQSYTKYRPNETTGGIFVSWRRKEELPMGA